MPLQRVTTEVHRIKGASSARLRVLTGDEASTEVSIPQAGLTVGGAQGCGVVLSDRAVSGRHAAIIPLEGGFEVRDLGSRNGTWLDGVAITRVVVPLGTTLRIGSTLLSLLPAEEPLALGLSEATSFGKLVGTSAAMRTIFTALERASPTTAPVLVLGESGTGKELAARAVHEQSPRASGPFVVFDCAAASETLIESELFGHTRGAFTGAHEARPGAFALADKGTLFLDEIGDLPLPLQPKLLRMIESGEVRPLGGRQSQHHDVRIVSATNRDLFEEVENGTFRGDLYYRLAVVELHLPPLRSRPEDIPELVRHFLRLGGRSTEDVSGPALDRLCTYAWPGNVRELRNVIARALALAAPGASFDKLPFLLRPSSRTAPAPTTVADRPYHEAREELLTRFEHDYVVDLLRRHGTNLSQAARVAGIERKYLYRLLEKTGLAPPGREPSE